tara:strand:- start:505 stop:957 length:453 start_codon:yes stop_codon:yes gene_type:complete
MSTERIGVNHKLYVSTSLMTDATGTGATWVEFLPTESTDSELTREEVTFKTRENGGLEVSAGGSFTATVSGSWVYLKGDAVQAAIINAIEAGSPVAIADVDGDIATAGTYGTIGNYSLSSVSSTKPVSGAVTMSFSAKLSDTFYDMNYTV